MKIADTRHIAFVSCNETHWGGSEELWGAAAAELARRGHRVSVAKPNLPKGEPAIKRLNEAKCTLHDLAKFPLLPKAFYGIFSLISRAAGLSWQLARLDIALRFSRPDMVILSQGGNWDGFLYAGVLRRLGIPYALICQKATELYWPSDWMRERCKAMYADAQGAYFVSHHNHRLTEEQMGMAIPRGEVVRNPFLTAWDAPLPWPDAGDGLRLACVGRFFPMEKGQDMLLRVMALPKWRARDVRVSFFGAGDRAEGLKEMAAFLGLDNVAFPGFVRNVQGGIWAQHHALILPTRAEGLPLVVVETMLAGRVTITTDVAGSAEVCSDGETGFIAAAPTEAAIDEAMERAWAARAEWPAIAAAAAASIRTQVPRDPASTFADIVLRLVDKGAVQAPARDYGEELVGAAE
ncbi:MAG: glycosyltransferase family 4 protein [Sphingomonas sp.]